MLVYHGSMGDQRRDQCVTVTAVIPVRDGAKTIAATLEPLQASTAPVEEILVVDDGSSGGTERLVERFMAGSPGSGSRLAAVAGGARGHTSRTPRPFVPLLRGHLDGQINRAHGENRVIRSGLYKLHRGIRDVNSQ